MSQQLTPTKLRIIIKAVCGGPAGLNLWSPVVEELLLLTAAHESHMGQYTKQVKGPALGIYQMEPATAMDLYANFLWYRQWLERKVNAFRRRTANGAMESLTTALETNEYFATAIARAYYFRFKTPLPLSAEFDGLYAYYKIHWNTVKGSATYKQVKQDYQRYVLDAEASAKAEADRPREVNPYDLPTSVGCRLASPCDLHEGGGLANLARKGNKGKH